MEKQRVFVTKKHVNWISILEKKKTRMLTFILYQTVSERDYRSKCEKSQNASTRKHSRKFL